MRSCSKTGIIWVASLEWERSVYRKLVYNMDGVLNESGFGGGSGPGDCSTWGEAASEGHGAGKSIVENGNIRPIFNI
jgi:hypothetical protein